MKRILILVVWCLSAGSLYSQIVESIGITAGITYGNQRYKFAEPAQNLRKDYVLRYNGSVRLEFFQHPYFRWVTEVQYNQKGSKETITNAANEEVTFKNKVDYVSWNNFLKFRVERLWWIPYVMVGPRLEYLVSAGSDNPVSFINQFKTIHLTGIAAIGIERVCYSNFKPFAEFHYNPDLRPALKITNLTGRNNAYELRLGLKYTFASKQANCNAPTYNGQ